MIHLDKLPLSEALVKTFGLPQAEQFALTGGEDYELCFTVPDRQREKLDQHLKHIGVNYTCIGQIRAWRASAKNALFFNVMGKRWKSPTLQDLIILNKDYARKTQTRDPVIAFV